MTMPTATADGVRANEDDSTTTRATRGGDVAQGQATTEREGAPSVADKEATERTLLARRAVRFGDGNAEGRGSGSGRVASLLPAGAKQSKAAHVGVPPTTGANPALCSAAPYSEPSAFEHRAARRAERFATEREERGSSGVGMAKTQHEPNRELQLNPTGNSGNTGGTYKRGTSFRTGCKTAPGNVVIGSKPAQIPYASSWSTHGTTARQGGAGKRRTVPTKHGGVTAADATATSREEAVAASAEGRQCEARPNSVPLSRDDETRKRRRALTQERGRSSLGSRRQEAEVAISRLQERWIYSLDQLGVLPKGEERAAALRSLGAQRQRADAYAEAAARAAPRGAGRPTPVAAGTSVPDGLEPTAAASASLDEMIKLPTYSMARIASESDDFVLRAPFPETNMSPEDDPMPPVPEAGESSPDPNWRPSTLTDVYTVDGIKRIMAWFAEMRCYEAAAVAKAGSGLNRPDDLILDDEYVRRRRAADRGI